ncbi:hypothetical protein OV203_09685 [Nannocystis sp. ILAH1]|uniref:hypothetical protein n=1 Tax=unclassified Nannocystis TaxID=2627009 RepID=UPI00226D91F1|nr:MULTISPECIES: hypothetical protein [unclassified Nannocystis]MCY0987393.1 hypothetical protein [Nannocystis sp. ILAH1]MCY1070812.1 hypothetical protein [Nannocystis sp. RBIL2]
MTTPRPGLALATPLLLAACIERPPPEPVEVPSVTIPLAGSQGHEPIWMSANARFVVLEDRSEARAGELAVTFVPRHVLHDTVLGTREPIDELLEYDRRNRRAIVQIGQRWWLLDSESDRRVELARDVHDDDPLPAFRFDRRGRTLAYTRARPDRVTVHDLASGDEHDVYVPSNLLGSVDALAEPGWVHFQGIVADEPSPPRGPHRCPLESDARCRDDVACLSDTDLGPVNALLHRDGAQIFMVEGLDDAQPMLQVRDAWAWEAVRPHDVAAQHWMSADGCEHALPRGCALQPRSIDWIGPALLNCGERGSFLWASTGLAPLLYFHGWLAEGAADRRGGLWRAAGVASPEGVRIARVSLDDGHMAFGPVLPVDGRESQTPRGWYLRDAGPEAPRVLAYDLTTGRAWQIDGAKLGHAGELVVGDTWRALDLDAGRHIVLDERPAAVAANGCALMPPAKRREWSLRCPEDRRLDSDE